jgi:release factor glutamine methyltransferase
MPLIEEALLHARHELDKICDNPQQEARTLLAFLLDKPTTWLIAWPEKQLCKDIWKQYLGFIERRKKAEPLAYIIGQKEFWSLNLKVTPDTLIPRADTECLVELALKLISLSKADSVLDLGTGSGAIALAIASEMPRLNITASDKSQAALLVAENNKATHNCNNVTLLQSDWFHQLKPQRFAVILSNPPYIRENDVHLAEAGLKHEPLSALVSGKFGLDDISKLIHTAPHWLSNNGYLALEHGFDQGPEVRALFKQANYTNPQTERDYAGHERVTYAQHTFSSAN